MTKYLIITKKHEMAHDEKSAEVKHDDCDYTKNKDWDYMKACGEVDKNHPATWIKYPNTIAGANDIITMEYNELMKNAKDGDLKAWKQNLVHLSVATLNGWRILKNEK